MNQQLNILMVDDHPAKLLSYEAILSELGDNLIRANSGAEALVQLFRTDISLILMDVSMPEMDGFETTKRIREHPQFQNIPIIFISAFLMTDLDRLRGYRQGAVDYVSVPIVPDLLRAKVKVFTDLSRKTKELDLLNVRLAMLQDEERRGLARELHDNVGQLLVAISLNNSLVESNAQALDADAVTRLRDNQAMLGEVCTQIRTISRILHPPLLDEAGLASAIRGYVEEFAERSKIETILDITPELGRLSSEIELSIFRIVQECLSNIRRHAESPTAVVRIQQANGTIRVEVEDAGKGIAFENLSKPTVEAGVGLRGIRERVRLLGGTLQVQSKSSGTKVTASLPVLLPDSGHADEDIRTRMNPVARNSSPTTQ